MRKTVLYIAMSLDGFIADENSNIDWLVGDNENMSNYLSFSTSVDTVIMGHKTYFQVTNELSPNNWPYPNMHAYIITHKNYNNNIENITFYNKSLSFLLNSLKEKEGKDIWICGGASIVNQLIKENQIDQYRISIIPTILGNGIKLFYNDNTKINLKLESSEINNGIIELIYNKK